MNQNTTTDKDLIIKQLNDKLTEKDFLIDTLLKQRKDQELSKTEELLITQQKVSKFKMVKAFNFNYYSCNKSLVDLLKVEIQRLKLMITEFSSKIKEKIQHFKNKIKVLEKQEVSFKIQISNLINKNSICKKEKFDLEEVIFQQEECINDLSSKLAEYELLLEKKNKEIKDISFQLSMIQEKAFKKQYGIFPSKSGQTLNNNPKYNIKPMISPIRKIKLTKNNSMLNLNSKKPNNLNLSNNNTLMEKGNDDVKEFNSYYSNINFNSNKLNKKSMRNLFQNFSFKSQLGSNIRYPENKELFGNNVIINNSGKEKLQEFRQLMDQICKNYDEEEDE